MPAGTAIDTNSPCSLAINCLAIGELIDILLSLYNALYNLHDVFLWVFFVSFFNSIEIIIIINPGEA